MIAAFQVRQGATAPWFELVLNRAGRPIQYEDPYGQCERGIDDPIDLTGKTVRALMWRCGRVPSPVVLRGTLEIVDAPKGIVAYRWAASDTATPGFYLFSVEVTDPATGTTLRWPYSMDQLTVEVTH